MSGSDTIRRERAADLQERIAALIPGPTPYSRSVQAYPEGTEAMIVDAGLLAALVADIQRMREEIAALRRGYAREELAAIDRKLASAREQRPNIEAPLVVWEYAFSLESRIEALVADNQRLREACP